MFTPKADGVRALLVMLRYHIDNDWQKMSILLYRDGTCQLIGGLHTTDEPCDGGGSLFDCEIVTLEDGPAALVFDCYAFNGVSYVKNTLSRRIARIKYLIESCYARQPNDAIVIREKPYFQLTAEHRADFDGFMNNTHFLGYPTDGVVIVPGALKRDRGVKGGDVQYKMKNHHTIDLIIVEDDWEHYLASYDDADDSYVTKQQLETLPMDAKVNDVIECYMTIDGGCVSFTPFMVRHDKTRPNMERVIELTINTVRDDVTADDFILANSRLTGE
jgi:hypothetical protein